MSLVAGRNESRLSGSQPGRGAGVSSSCLGLSWAPVRDAIREERGQGDGVEADDHHRVSPVAHGWCSDGAERAHVLMVALLFFVFCSPPPDCEHLVGHYGERGQQRDPHVPGLRETGAHRHVAAPLWER